MTGSFLCVLGPKCPLGIKSSINLIQNFTNIIGCKSFRWDLLLGHKQLGAQCLLLPRIYRDSFLHQQNKNGIDYKSSYDYVSGENTITIFRFAIIMKLLNVILAILLAAGASALRTERKGIVLAAEDENVQRSLDKGGKCPKQNKEEDYYNALFLLKDDTEKALCDCSDMQMFEIGELIRKITIEVDKTFPEIPQAGDVTDINTEVCTIPVIWAEGEGAQSSGRHRSLGRR